MKMHGPKNKISNISFEISTNFRPILDQLLAIYTASVSHIRLAVHVLHVIWDLYNNKK